jgi:cytochrome bd ubiquinol oxidase subunit II
MIPFAITVDTGAAPHSSLAFMFWGARIFVYPLMLLCAVVGYHVFHDRLELTADNHQGYGTAYLEAISSPRLAG